MSDAARNENFRQQNLKYLLDLSTDDIYPTLPEGVQGIVTLFLKGKYTSWEAMRHLATLGWETEPEVIGTPPVSVALCRSACAEQGVNWETLSDWQKFLVADKVLQGWPVRFKNVPNPDVYDIKIYKEGS